MLRKYIIIGFIILPVISYSQIAAKIDENGKEVILNNDGTWKYAESSKIEFTGNGLWEINFYVDEFGDPTDSGYISNVDIIEGTFSNSATSNSLLYAYFLVSGKGNIAIKLLEYGSSEVNAYSTKYYEVKVKDAQGTVHSLPGRIYQGGERLYIDSSTRKNKISKMHNLLLKGGELQFSITSSEAYTGGYPSTYKFSINADGYSNAFDSLFNRN